MAETYHKCTRDEIGLTEHWLCFNYELLLEAARSASLALVQLTSDKKIGRGFYHVTQNIIYINTEQSTSMMLAATIQGIAYSRLYHSEHCEKDMGIVNLEAESAAYITSHYLGLDIGTQQFYNIAQQVDKTHNSSVQEVDMLFEKIKREASIYKASRRFCE